MNETNVWPEYIFHGGCHGCTQQNIHGVEFCMDCQYFDANWSLPDLNNRTLSKAEEIRNSLKANYPSRNPRRKYDDN